LLLPVLLAVSLTAHCINNTFTEKIYKRINDIMKIENLALILTPVTLIFALSFIDIKEDTESTSANDTISNPANNPGDTEQIAKSDESSSSESTEVDAMIETYKEIQQQEEAAFQEKISEKWGEYKSSSAKEWLSYSGNANIRKTVNYETGEVSVELLLPESATVENKVKNLLEKETHRLLNITEAEAFLSDEISQKIEGRLPANNDIIKRGNPDSSPLFNVDKMPALEFNYSGFIKASSNARTSVTTRMKKSKIKGKVIAQSKLKLDKSVLQKTEQYAKTLTLMAKNQSISPALVYAIIESESNFNPMAKSHIPAYGLMQIVPESAGKDATTHIWGKAKVLAPSYLYSSINNIHIGVAYLHVLYYKYLGGVKNPQSRVYCAIAAYNTGASNVARAFIRQKNFNRATKRINKMSSNQVYNTLVKRLPYRETRKYVKKVKKAMDHYWVLQQQNVI